VPSRIAIITYDFPAVSETFVVDHVIGMARRGWSPVVVCDRVDGAALEALQARAGITIPVYAVEPLGRAWATIPRRLLSIVRTVLRHPRVLGSATGRAVVARGAALGEALRAAAPDVVHAHFGPNGVAAAIALGDGVPLVVDFHGTDFTVVPSVAGWDLYRSFLHRAGVVVHSAFAVRVLGTGLPNVIWRVRIGVDSALFTANRGEAWRAPLRLLTVGRLSEQKGHAVAIRALAELRRTAPVFDAVLRIVGQGPERSRLEALAGRLGVAGSVSFAGPLPQERVAAEMREADVLLVPSIVGPDGAQEGFGRVAVEGLASGLAVIASATGGLPEIMGDAGAVLPPDDAGALAAAVRRLAAEETPRTCAARSRARASEYTIERMWDDYALAAERALPGNGPVHADVCS
jgi:colanic acid/amylovoran biosynthesis glycosyltransferase